MNSTARVSRENASSQGCRTSLLGHSFLIRLSWIVLACCSPSLVLSQQPPLPLQPSTGSPDVPQGTTSTAQLPSDPQSPGAISGILLDQHGAPVVAVRVTLVRDPQSPTQQVVTGDDGRFSFAGISPGPFQLTFAAPGFATQTSSGTLHPGEALTLPQITLAVATEVTQVRVELTPIEIAQAQMNDEEKQRVLGFVPNFYVSYVPDAVPLTSKQKFQLAWKSSIDPVNFGITAAVAGIQQGSDDFSGYGQGAQGYAKRYGASYADSLTGTFIGSAILPSLLKQDPRYFYKGSGSVHSRIFYAVANSVICKGDNRRWQPNYSYVLGSIASGGISNLYYPEGDRSGVALTFENALINIGATAAANILQEFVLRKLTPTTPASSPASP